MGFRFRKSIKLIPGVKLNLGKRGSSLSIGGRGATVNISKKGTRTTLGLPGTGVSHTTYSPHKKGATSNPPAQGLTALGWIIIFALGFLLVKAFS